MPNLIDTHLHLNFEAYDEDRDALLVRAQAAGVRRVINPAVDLETSRAAIGLARQYSGVFAAVGIHPNSTADFAPSKNAELRALAQQPGVVAVGEIGLDYHWDKSPKTRQFQAFEAQLALAAEVGLPVIIHNREASDDVMAILETWVRGLSSPLKEQPGVMHSFSASAAIAERSVALGFYLGFTGPVTYKNADELRSIAAQIPLEHMLLETDGPFLTPHPFRGKRNEPAYIPLIADRLASLRQLSVETIGQATTTNAVRLFRLPEGMVLAG